MLRISPYLHIRLVSIDGDEEIVIEDVRDPQAALVLTMEQARHLQTGLAMLVPSPRNGRVRQGTNSI